MVSRAMLVVILGKSSSIVVEDELDLETVPGKSDTLEKVGE